MQTSQATEPDFNQLKKLWTLKQVVETGSFRQAATRNKVTVSAVSQALTHLERSLGRKLFVRKDRRLLPTTFCTELLDAAEPAFKTLTYLQNVQNPICEIPKMTYLDFGVSESMAGNLLPGFVRQMREKLPGMKLTLRVSKCHDLIKLVKDGTLCMALVADSDAAKGVSIYPIAEERLGVYCSAQHRFDLANPVAILESGIACAVAGPNGYPTYYARFLNAIQRGFRPALTSDSLETLYSIAVSGTMPAVLPERMAQRVPGLLKEIPLPDATKNKNQLGRYAISMVSQKVCDPAEDLFLISELKSLF